MPSVAHAYRGVLTGGLSNQLMHLAEALERACSADAYLVLPRFNAGWFNHVDEATGHAFTALFDLPRAASALRPCRLVSGDLGAPPGMQVVARPISDLHPINASWPHWEWFGRLMAALRPAPPVRKGVASLERWVRARVGAKWMAIHLRLERDWEGAGFCDVGRFPVRRCWEADEVAARTAAVRARRNVSGVALVYARHNLDVARHPIRLASFGGAATVLPDMVSATGARATASYTIQALIQLFVAVRAPGGFAGNAYSSFDRAVGALRAARRRGPSFAYDCNVAPSVCELRRVGECSVVGR